MINKNTNEEINKWITERNKVHLNECNDKRQKKRNIEFKEVRMNAIMNKENEIKELVKRSQRVW